MYWEDVGFRARARSKSEPANEVEWRLLVNVFDCGCVNGSSNMSVRRAGNMNTYSLLIAC